MYIAANNTVINSTGGLLITAGLSGTTGSFLGALTGYGTGYFAGGITASTGYFYNGLTVSGTGLTVLGNTGLFVSGTGTFNGGITCTSGYFSGSLTTGGLMNCASGYFSNGMSLGSGGTHPAFWFGTTQSTPSAGIGMFCDGNYKVHLYGAPFYADSGLSGSTLYSNSTITGLGTGYFSGGISATTGYFSGGISAGTGSFSGALVVGGTGFLNGGITATTGYFTNLSASNFNGTGNFNGALVVSGTGYFNGGISASTGVFTNLSATNFSYAGSNTFSSLITANGGITASTGYYTSGLISSMTGSVLFNVNPSPIYAYVVEQFGALVDGIVLTGGSINNGSNILNCSTANWSSNDVGKQISVSGGGTLITTILSINSSTQIVLNSNASYSSIGTSQIIYGHDDTPAWRNAMASLGTVGGTIFCSKTGISLLNSAPGSSKWLCWSY